MLDRSSAKNGVSKPSWGYRARVRWQFLVAVTLALIPSPAAWANSAFDISIAKIETRLKGRVGVFAMRGPAKLGYRSGERFAYCSTFKWVLAAAVLKGVDGGQLDLTRVVPYKKEDLLAYSPVTGKHVQKGGMGIGDLCAATIITSDNTAANLLYPLVSGPTGLQDFVRSMNDSITRFDRMEPELNSNLRGDPRDTTTPEAMTRLLHNVLESETLSKASRNQLLSWMKATTTGQARIRASIPQGWVIGNKTGTGNRGAVNDVAVIFPPKGDPIYLSVFTDDDRSDLKAHEEAIAEVAKQVLEALP
ncbi:Beta-lactamase precursor [compost metagenome]